MKRQKLSIADQQAIGRGVARAHGKRAIDAIRAGDVDDARTWAIFAAHSALIAMGDEDHRNRCACQ